MKRVKTENAVLLTLVIRSGYSRSAQYSSNGKPFERYYKTTLREWRVSTSGSKSYTMDYERGKARIRAWDKDENTTVFRMPDLDWR